MCDWDTVETYMDNHPDDFPADKLREAMRRQMLVWEKIGLEGTMGEIMCAHWRARKQEAMAWW